MLFSSPIFSQASGSVAGLTFAHSRSGMTIRARSTPTNPDTERQRTVKHAVARLAPYWGNELDQAQRDAWDLYGDNVSMTNALGQAFFLTGQNHFLRANVPRIQAGISVLETAPTIFDLGTFTAPTIAFAQQSPPVFSIGFEETDSWANAVGGYMLIYQGRPVGPGRGFFNGPFNFVARVDGDPVPPSSPKTVVPSWVLKEGHLLWVNASVIQVDGRLSFPITIGPKTVDA